MITKTPVKQPIKPKNVSPLNIAFKELITRIDAIIDGYNINGRLNDMLMELNAAVDFTKVEIKTMSDKSADELEYLKQSHEEDINELKDQLKQSENWSLKLKVNNLADQIKVENFVKQIYPFENDQKNYQLNF